MVVYCPVPKCERRTYANTEELLTHLKKAQSEGDPNHIDIVILEGWDERSDGVPVKMAKDLEET